MANADRYLIQDHPALRRYKKLTKSLCEMIDSYGLVSFESLCVEDKDRMKNLLKCADIANGFELANVQDFRSVVMKNS